MKKYQIIYADPPWSYKDKALAGNRGACCKYPTQSIEWLKSLRVADVADVDCALFMWVTMPKLNECFDVIKAWSFEYKTCAFVWVKTNKKTNISQTSFILSDSFDSFMGMGRWTRANAELCLLATKGKPKRINAGVRQLIYSPLEAHSKKPNDTKDRIITLIGDVPRIELFARQKTEGWDSIGYDIDGIDINKSIAKILLAK